MAIGGVWRPRTRRSANARTPGRRFSHRWQRALPDTRTHGQRTQECPGSLATSATGEARTWQLRLRHLTHSISILSLQLGSVQFRPPLISSPSPSHSLTSSVVSIARRAPVDVPASARVPSSISISIFTSMCSPFRPPPLYYIPSRNAECSLCLDDCHRAVDARIHTSITRSCSHVVYSMLRRPTVIRPEGLRRLPSVRSRDPLILHLLDMLPAGTRAPTHMHICTSVLIAPSL